MIVADATGALAEHGLIPRGGFTFGTDERAPAGPSGKPARAVMLVGHGGGAFWPHFSKWRANRPDIASDPLDTWSKELLCAIAARFGARAVFPSDRPYLPFQKWAMRAEGLRPSPLGILMHPQFGLWHAYRGALLFDIEIVTDDPGDAVHLCDQCEGKDCIMACPVQAVCLDGVEVDRCRGHLATDAGAACVHQGCRARAACPHDRFAYGPEQAAFHMAAYAGTATGR